jgi:hypothetical protein
MTTACRVATATYAAQQAEGFLWTVYGFSRIVRHWRH